MIGVAGAIQRDGHLLQRRLVEVPPALPREAERECEARRIEQRDQVIRLRRRVDGNPVRGVFDHRRRYRRPEILP